ncbi:UPF0450 protein C17orf58 homolog isoform X3 [Eleutherodactylus coqui]|uniref:UPF0450 protein C17orf58 homolog isoform X3 n=1 Tax=Eleutherodactylus coqui TaxID=57060 RepID=UPI0034620236
MPLISMRLAERRQRSSALQLISIRMLPGAGCALMLLVTAAAVAQRDSKERTCLMDYHKERHEREAYCHSDFAVNGIVHDVDSVGRDVQLLTVLVNSGGLYKMNRLYITPDGVFFRVRILVVNNPHCHQSCLHFSLGGRYIIMGQVYNKRMEVPTSIQQVISTHLRAGDGLVTSGRSFFRRFNRKKERKVLAAAHSKCK